MIKLLVRWIPEKTQKTSLKSRDFNRASRFLGNSSTRSYNNSLRVFIKHLKQNNIKRWIRYNMYAYQNYNNNNDSNYHV